MLLAQRLPAQRADRSAGDLELLDALLQLVHFLLQALVLRLPFGLLVAGGQGLTFQLLPLRHPGLGRGELLFGGDDLRLQFLLERELRLDLCGLRLEPAALLREPGLFGFDFQAQRLALLIVLAEADRGLVLPRQFLRAPPASPGRRTGSPAARAVRSW